MRSKRPKVWRRRFALFLGGLAVSVLIVEIGLRAAGVSNPTLSRPDSQRGWSLLPNAAGRYTKEGSAFVKINSRGLRDREHAIEKSPGTYRIAVLGDSYAEAREVSQENAFWTVLESELNARGLPGGKQVEVINFGVRGYGTAQELLTLRCCVWDYAPDLVLLAFLTGNDVDDNSPLLDRASTRFARPYFLWRDEELVPDFSFRTSPYFVLARIMTPVMQHSRILQLAVRAHHATFNQPPPDYSIRTSAVPELDEPGLDRSVYREPATDAMREGWRATEGLLLLMRDEVEAKDTDFVVVTLSSSSQVHPDPTVRGHILKWLGVADLFYPDLRIRALGEKEGIPVLNLAMPFQAYAEDRQVFLHGFENREIGKGHWNIEGHRLAGELIARWLVERKHLE